MTKIIAISGKKQAGKNTSANHFHGRVLKNIGNISDFALDQSGNLHVLTKNSEGTEAWGQWDITRHDEQFLQYAEANMWPYVKIYVFADALKELCTGLFDIPYECVWGTDEQKNTVMPHLLWENMPGNKKSKTSKFPTKGPMTARQFMQYFGTEVMRKMYGNIWVSNLMKRIIRDGSELAVVADLRFPNECDAILDAGGTVIRLTRNTLNDQHESELALDDGNYDQSRFTHIVDNAPESYTIEDLCTDLDKIYKGMMQ